MRPQRRARVESQALHPRQEPTTPQRPPADGGRRCRGFRSSTSPRAPTIRQIRDRAGSCLARPAARINNRAARSGARPISVRCRHRRSPPALAGYGNRRSRSPHKLAPALRQARLRRRIRIESLLRPFADRDGRSARWESTSTPPRKRRRSRRFRESVAANPSYVRFQILRLRVEKRRHRRGPARARRASCRNASQKRNAPPSATAPRGSGRADKRESFPCFPRTARPHHSDPLLARIRPQKASTPSSQSRRWTTRSAA